jgi:hypothetical protein
MVQAHGLLFSSPTLQKNVWHRSYSFSLEFEICFKFIMFHMLFQHRKCRQFAAAAANIAATGRSAAVAAFHRAAATFTAVAITAAAAAAAAAAASRIESQVAGQSSDPEHRAGATFKEIVTDKNPRLIFSLPLIRRFETDCSAQSVHCRSGHR